MTLKIWERNGFSREASYRVSCRVLELIRNKHICDTLLDFFDPDPTKRIYCQNEILAKIRADLIRKYGEGNLPTDPNKLYDLESDTSGSDSSSDEGLPAHIEHIQQSQVKIEINTKFFGCFIKFLGEEN